MTILPRRADALLLVPSGLLALVLCELLLRVFAPQPLDAAYVWPDGTLRHLPSFRYTYTRAGFSNDVRYNALGLRGPEPAPARADGRLRLAVLGDSFVEGKQVGEDAVFTARLERQAVAGGLRLEVLNAGMGGYGTGDELLLWERVVAGLRPDLVLLAFFPNDVRNNVERAWFDLRAGRVVQVAEPPRPRLRWLYDAQKFLVARSHLAYLVKSAVLTWSGAAPDQRQAPPAIPRGQLVEDEGVFLVQPPADIARGWTLSFALLAELCGRVAASGARCAVLLVPDRYQVDAALWGQHVARLGLDAAAFDLERPQRLFATWSSETGIPVIDLLPELRARNRDNTFYYEIDAHWNEAGHALVADTLLRELVAHGLVGEPNAARSAASAER